MTSWWGGAPPADTPLEVVGWWAELSLGLGNIASAEAFGTPRVADMKTVAPTGIASGEAFGTHAVTYSQTLLPTGIISREQFDEPTVVRGNRNTPVPSIPSAEAFGTPRFNQSVGGAGIPTGERGDRLLATVIDRPRSCRSHRGSLWLD